VLLAATTELLAQSSRGTTMVIPEQQAEDISGQFWREKCMSSG
jgi:hypothetical protein